MADKDALRTLLEDYETAVGGRKNGDRRTVPPPHRELVALLRGIVDALPE